MSQFGDYDYDTHGRGYSQLRRADPHIATLIHAALGDARTVLNIGAGAGSYEPTDRYVIALEPSAVMRAQRPPNLVPAIHGVAENLPLDDQSVDAAMAVLTVHHWPNLERGLQELRRVARGPIVIMTADREALNRFWLAEYAPEFLAVESRRYPAIERITTALGGVSETETIPIPVDCVDGFADAYYARPERLLDQAVRNSQSGWGRVPADAQARFVARLSADLASGAWDEKYGDWRQRPYFEGSMRLIINRG